MSPQLNVEKIIPGEKSNRSLRLLTAGGLDNECKGKLGISTGQRGIVKDRLRACIGLIGRRSGHCRLRGVPRKNTNGK